MKIPKQYEWLASLKGPKMIVEAMKLYGTAEIVGKKHNPVIIGWAKELGIGDLYISDETPWCGLVHAVIIKRAGKDLPLSGYNILRAAKYQFFGNRVQVKDAMLGDTLVFERPGGAHVGLYVGEDETCFHVLGGNQSNAYNVARILKSRCISARRPQYNIQPVEVKKYLLKSTGEISRNEK